MLDLTDWVDPHQRLRGVHPDLCRIMLHATQTPQPFIIVYGARTVEAEKIAVSTGHSTTMHSRHLPNAEGLACAVDVCALDTHGQLDWAAGREAEVFGKIAEQVKASAADLHLPVEWGGDWHSFKDWGHFQLPWKDYP